LDHREKLESDKLTDEVFSVQVRELGSIERHNKRQSKVKGSTH
jgi:hypothetical protein